jgi:F-type H+-transporting ATPase subunit b
VLLAEAYQRMEQEQASWQTHLDEEARKYTTRMYRAGAGALLSLTRKALIDLADETLEERMARHLVQQIKPIAADLHRAAGEATVAVVTSHESLPKTAQDGFAAELKAMFPHISVQFDTDADQAPGLVLRMGGAQLAWTVDSYIDGLESLIGKQLASGGELKVNSHEH